MTKEEMRYLVVGYLVTGNSVWDLIETYVDDVQVLKLVGSIKEEIDELLSEDPETFEGSLDDYVRVGKEFETFKNKTIFA